MYLQISITVVFKNRDDVVDNNCFHIVYKFKDELAADYSQAYTSIIRK
jgi:hypothetical protein